MAEQLKNSLDNPTSTLAAGITSGALSLTVQSGHGNARLPATGDFRLKLTDQSDDSLYELVVGTARSSDVVTMTRGAEGTTARAFVTGDHVDLVLSAAAMVAYVAENPSAASVILAPASSARNVIQPTLGSVIAAVVKAHATQTVDLLQFQSSAASVLARVNEAGWLGIGVDPVYPLDIYNAVTGAGSAPLIQYIGGIRSIVDVTSPNDANPGNTVYPHYFEANAVDRLNSAGMDHIYGARVRMQANAPTVIGGDNLDISGLFVDVLTHTDNTWPISGMYGIYSSVQHEADQTLPLAVGFQMGVYTYVAEISSVVEGMVNLGGSEAGITLPQWVGFRIAPPYLDGVADVIANYVALDIDDTDNSGGGSFEDFTGIRVRTPAQAISGTHIGILVDGGKSVFVDTLLLGRVTAPADADLANSQGGWWWDQATPLMKWKGKTSGGTVVNLSPYVAGGTDVALADGGTGASLTDPNADRILFWDDSAGAVTWLTAGTNLTITGTTIDAAGGGGGAPTDAQYIVGAANGSLSAEIVASSFALTLIDDTDAATARATLGLAVGTDVPSLDAARLVRHTAGLYYTAPQFNVATSTSSKSMTTDKAWFVPFWVPKAISLDRIGVGIWSGVATSVVRLGVYRDNGSGKPGALVAEAASTVDTSGSGPVEATIAATLTADLYWLCAASQTAAASLRSIAVCSSSVGGTLSEAVTNTLNLWSRTSVSGALPDPAGTVAADANTTPVIAVRAA